MKALDIARAARADLEEIATYTEREWGPEQKTRYMAALQAAFLRICEHPLVGTLRADLRIGNRSLPCGSHVIFYRDRSKDIQIVRVLHGSMDFRRHLTVTTRRPRGSRR